MSLIIEANRIATKAHEGQTRKYTSEPYIVHPRRVANEVMLYDKATEDMVVAAYLHDTLEDCYNKLVDGKPFTGITIGEKFGTDVFNLVYELTNDYTKVRCPDLNREERKKLEVERLSQCCDEAKILKLFDRIDNLEDLERAGKRLVGSGFLKKYVKESIQLAESINVDKKLYTKLINKCLDILKQME